MGQPEEAEVGEKLDISILAGRQRRLMCIAVQGVRTEDLTTSVSAEAWIDNWGELRTTLFAVFDSWSNWGVQGLSSLFVRDHLQWTTLPSDENDF